MAISNTAVPVSPLPVLDRPISALPGIGPERAVQLVRLGISTVEDLLLHRPRRYEDRRHFRPIAELQLDEPATTRGTIVALGVKWYRQHTKSIFEFVLEDGTARLHCRWWNLPFMEKYFKRGDEVVVFGKPVTLRPRTMDHPETEIVEGGEESVIHLNRITPVYPLTEGLTQRWLRALIWRTLALYESKIAEPLDVARLKAAGCDLKLWSAAPSGGTAASQLYLPSSFPTRAQAVRMLHVPETEEAIDCARRRLALDEFVVLQKQIQGRRRNFESKSRAIPCAGDNHLIRPFLARLGFKLTDAQTRVLRELRKDMGGEHPMRRLLQGDVGSGKTVVAACCALMSLESGHSVALMAPTEILAEQHFRTFSAWLEPLGIRVDVRTGSRKSSPRVAGANSAAALVIGTHALLTEGFDVPGLGLVIIDEQHKFGVTQRERLVRKGRYPHLLVMTATPIPRTLGLTLYGDLDVSVIDQLPPGRGRIQTFVRTADKMAKVLEFVRSQLKSGRQAYLVYPRVEESGAGGVKAVTQEFETLRAKLTPYRAGLLHGRLSAREKDAVMAQFRANAIQALVATSLIEVGVDVPNATVMVVENAEQFGLAQLHQLRGRIGRGANQSYCVLVAAAKTRDAKERLRALETTTDGFLIAETDLKLRGPGELLGQEQSGMPRFRFGDLAADLALIEQARRIAQCMI